MIHPAEKNSATIKKKDEKPLKYEFNNLEGIKSTWFSFQYNVYIYIHLQVE